MNKKDFKKLQDEWYKKLEDSGFDDIETNNSKNCVYREITGIYNPKHILYFEICLAYLHSGKIKDPLSMFIFEKHCDGVTNRNIAKLLPSHGFRSYTSRSIDLKLKKILIEAEIDPLEFNK